MDKLQFPLSDEFFRRQEEEFNCLLERLVLEHVALGLFRLGQRMPLAEFPRLKCKYETLGSAFEIRPVAFAGLFRFSDGVLSVTEDGELVNRLQKSALFSPHMALYFPGEHADACADFLAKAYGEFLALLHTPPDPELELWETDTEPDPLETAMSDPTGIIVRRNIRSIVGKLAARELSAGSVVTSLLTEEVPAFSPLLLMGSGLFCRDKRGYRVTTRNYWPEFYLTLFEGVGFLSPICRNAYLQKLMTRYVN